jgi:hypothetical protein
MTKKYRPVTEDVESENDDNTPGKSAPKGATKTFVESDAWD